MLVNSIMMTHDTQAKLELVAGYQTCCDNGDLVGFLEKLCAIAWRSNNSGMEFLPFKVIVAVKLLLNLTNQDVVQRHPLKEELKTKYKVTKTINSKFLLEIGLLCQACFANFPLTVSAGQALPQYWVMNDSDQLKWEQFYDVLVVVLAIIFLNNSENNAPKRDAQ